MAEQRSSIEFTVDGLSIAALTAGPTVGGAAFRGKPLIAALHGGTFTARYFDVAGSPQGSFLDVAAGMGAVIRAGGPAHALASLPADETVDLPYDQRDQVMFGPASTWTGAAVQAAHASYAPTPVRELIQAPQWPDEHLPGLAPRITVPVHNALAEFDALWDSTPANVEHFAKLLTAAPFVDASIARATGHSIDHHILGHALHLRQFAFAEECQLWASQRS